MCGLPVAALVIVSDPFFTPALVGANVTSMMQLEKALIKVQPGDLANSPLTT
jgi:hypothetical protein